MNISRIYNDKIKGHRHYDRALHWTKLISITGGAQISIQALGLLSSILIIRFLSTQEYAYYTIANTMLGALAILSDGGISNGVMIFGGRVWQDSKKLGTVMSTGLALRYRFAFYGLLVCIPILVYLLYKQSATILTIVFVVVAVIPSAYAALSDSLLEVIPKLHQDIKPLQKNQLSVALYRFIFNGLSLVFFPFTAVALLASGLPRLYGNYKLRGIVQKKASINEGLDVDIKKDILSVVYKILPTSIYFCISGQITIWMLSFFGNSSNIAQIGALSRFSIIMTLFSTVFATVFMPRFARLESSKSLVLKYFLSSQVIIYVFSVFIIAFVYLFPNVFLYILGKSYFGLSNELLLIVISSCINMLASITGNLLGSRGYILNAYFNIAVNISVFILAAIYLDMGSIKGVLYYSIVSSIITYLITIVYTAYIFKNDKV